MLLKSVARRLNQGGALLLLCVCLQLVDGRRLDDAFVADLLCPRLHGGTAPIVSYVSAPLVRVRVWICASVHLCECALLPVRVGVLVGVPDFVCVGACVFARRAKSTDSRAEPHGVLEAARASTA